MLRLLYLLVYYVLMALGLFPINENEKIVNLDILPLPAKQNEYQKQLEKGEMIEGRKV